MKKYLQKQGYLSLLLLYLAGSAVAVHSDPSGGACDGLDPSSQLFSTCIQAHSAARRVDHLTQVGASATAIDKAQASLDDAIADYAALGGGIIPGLKAIGGGGPGGGIVFYIGASGLHGLEAAPYGWYNDGTDPRAAWGCEGTTTGATGTAIGTGVTNTATILGNTCADGATHIAAYLAAHYTWPNGQTDGFLPSKDELNAMYYNIGPGAAAPNTNVGGFATTDYYWSSTEIDSDVAWGQSFYDGGQGDGSKDNTLRVRAVRAF